MEAVRDAFWDRQSSPPDLDPTKHHTLAEMQNAAPGTIWSTLGGGSGTVVPKANSDGEPMDFDPKSVPTRVIIDPEIPGGGFELDMTKVPRSVLGDTVKEMRVREASTVEDRRLLAANALRRFAGVAKPTVFNTPFVETGRPMTELPPAMATPEPEPNAPIGSGTTATGHSAAASIKAASFGLAPEEPAAPSRVTVSPQKSLFNRRANAPAAAVPADQVGPPKFGAILEVHGTYTKQKAYYHQIIKDGSTLVLVFDRRAKGYTETFPDNPKGKQLEIAVQLMDEEGNPASSVYATRLTNHQFELDSYFLCVLEILDEWPAEPEEE